MTSYRVGQLAKAAGVTPDTPRYYEKAGLLAPRRKGTAAYRDYGIEDFRRLGFVRHAKACGFSLREIRALLSLPEQRGACCDDVRRLAVDKKLELERIIGDMKRMSTLFDQLIDACNDEARPIEECPILRGL